MHDALARVHGHQAKYGGGKLSVAIVHVTILEILRATLRILVNTVLMAFCLLSRHA